MTEAEWLVSTNPLEMLKFLRGPYTISQNRGVVYGPGLASDRKLRLFCVACCRRQFLLIDEARCSRLVEFGNQLRRDGVIHRRTLNTKSAQVSCRQALELAEQAADGPVDSEEWESAAQVARDITIRDDFPPFDWVDLGTADAEVLASGYVAGAVGGTCNSKVFYNVIESVVRDLALAATYLRHTGRQVVRDGDATELAAQAALLRETFGPRPQFPITFAPSWRTETVVTLASGIYAERAFDRMPILADALEEAGCDHADVLTHCRGPGQHVRGCWVVDGVLGKE